jgi:hypothetical protein
MRSIVAVTALLFALQPSSPGSATSACDETYGTCMSLCVKQSGLTQTPPERCMLACVQNRTRCVKAAQPAQPVQTEPQAAEAQPQPARAQATPPAAPPVPAAEAEGAVEPNRTFRWDQARRLFSGAFKHSPISSSAGNPEIPLH